MSRINFTQTSFLGGEFSPRTVGRTDLPRYTHGAQELLNMIVRPNGGAQRRNGTKYVTNTSSDLKTRLIPFVPNDEETYIVAITGIQDSTTNSTVTVINTSSLVETSVSTTLVGGVFLENDLDEIQYIQIADTLVMLNQNREPLILQRTGIDTFSLTEWTSGLIGPFSESADETIYGYFSNPSPSISLTPNNVPVASFDGTLTASAAFFTAPTGTGLTADLGHVNAIFQINNGFIQIGEVVSATEARYTTLQAAGTSSTRDFYESWSDAAGWPRTGQFFQNRLFFAGGVTKPDTVWFSRVENFADFNFRADVLASSVTSASPGSFTIASAKYNQIQWLSGTKNLNIGTLGDEYIASDISGDTIPSVTRETSIGSAYAQPVQISSELMFINKTRRSINEFQYNLDANTYRSIGMSLLSEHMYDQFENANAISTSGFRNISLQESPNQILWASTRGGGWVGLSRLIDQNIVAWHKHQPGGVSDGSDTPAIVEDVVAIPSADDTYEQVWLVVKRFIDGSTVRHIEYIGKDYRRSSLDSTNEDEIFVDSAVVASPGGTTVTGLSHLEGETVQVMADGKYVGTKTVASGEITLDASADDVIVGLPFTSKIKTLPLEVGSANGAVAGQTARVDRVTLRVYDTIGVEFSNNDSDFEEVEFRDFTAPIGDPIAPFTGVKVLQIQNMEVPNGSVENGVITLRQQKPLPMNISSITMRAQVYET